MTGEVIFKLSPALTEAEREEILGKVRLIPGVEMVAPIRRSSTRPLGRHLCFARAGAETDLAALAHAVAALDEVQYAEVPPKRTLASS